MAENIEKTKKLVSAFSIPPELDKKITEAAGQEMGGNRSKWLVKLLQEHFAHGQQ